MSDETRTETADVIDLPIKKDSLPIPQALLTELRQLQGAKSQLEARLGQLVASYGRQKTELLGKIGQADTTFATRARDALLCAGAELGGDEVKWDVDLREGVIRRA